jgi:hypothetical protein
VSKYLTKDLFGAVKSKKKRISTSRGIRLFEKRPPLGWRMDFKSIDFHHWIHRLSRREIVSEVVTDEVGLKSFFVAASPEAGFS